MSCNTKFIGFFSLVILIYMFFNVPAFSGNHWFSGPVMENSKSDNDDEADAKLLDIVISLYNNPTENRYVYESIIKSFADGVYEQSNAMHKIRKVRIYTNGKYSDGCDILWNERGNPSATRHYGFSGSHINMFNQMKYGNGTDLFLLDMPSKAGYVIAHEWGHYYYGLYDEYRGKDSLHWKSHMPWDTDEPVSPSIMNNQWNAFPLNFEWLNHSTAKNNTKKTAQHRIFQASGWETLVRPTEDDPRTGTFWTRPDRIFWPELKDVAPAPDEDPRIDLPGSARSDLEIIWMDEKYVFQIVFDNSSNMKNDNRLDNTKTAVNLLIDQAIKGTTSMGLIRFSNKAYVVQSIMEINSELDKTQLKSKINSTSTYSATNNLGQALDLAIKGLNALGTSDDSKAVFLISSGKYPTGDDPLSFISEFQSAQVPIFSFSCDSYADEALNALAKATKGNLYILTSKLKDYINSFQHANQKFTQRKAFSGGAKKCDSLVTNYSQIKIDSTVNSMDVVVNYPGTSSTDQLSLFDPKGVLYSPTSEDQSGSETLCQYSIDNPESGNWKLEITPVGEPLFVNYQASGLTKEEITYSLSVTSFNGGVIHYPDPMVLSVKLEKELSIAGINLYADLEKPDGNIESFVLKDDGVAPDFIADDGDYTTIIDYDQNGTYNINIIANNDLGTARSTYNGISVSPDENGEQLDPIPDESITENFSRYASLQITIEDFEDDDHSNNPEEATNIKPDNSDNAGKIDFENDIDFFSVETPIDATNLTFRITESASGFDPILRVYDQDGTSILGEVFTKNTLYPKLVISGNPGDIRYAGIQQKDSNAGGLYKFSVGQELASDNYLPPTPTPTKTETPKPSPTTTATLTPTGQPEAEIDIYANGTNFGPGDTIEISVKVDMPYYGVVDMYATLPLGGLFFWYPVWANIPHATVISESEWDEIILSITLGEERPKGSYSFYAAIMEHETGNVLDLDGVTIAIE